MKSIRFLMAVLFSIALAACGGGGGSPSAGTYGIAGAVTSSGTALAGATITLTGGSTSTTDASGNYSFTGLANGNYTVTPTKAGVVFSPTSLAVSVNGANVTGMNFTSTNATPHSLSGTVSGDTVSGVTVTVTGAVTASTTTDASGNYSVTGLYDGSYTVTPSKAGYSFTPTSLAATISGANINGKNFVAVANSAPTYSISGAVSGGVLSGVTITLSGAGSATATTNASGNYTFTGLVNGSYTITPSMNGYTFSPASAPANVSGANIAGTNFVATAAITAAYTQADLTGTWRINMLRTGSSSGWLRATGAVDSTGLMTVSSFIDSTGNSTPPPANSMQWTINSSGVVSESGVNGGSQVHMTMTSNKNLIAGTGDGDGHQLRIIQKVVPGTVYSNADIQNKTFVFHQLRVGSQSKWAYGAGTIDAAGQMTTTSEVDSAGPVTPGAQGSISVDSAGVVTMSPDMATFSGFLSDDKKTIVGTFTDDAGGGNVRYRLVVIQITGQTYPAGPAPAGAWASHLLAAGSAAPAPFWLHYTVTIASAGVITFSDWVASNPALTAGPSQTASITASGTMTLAEGPSFHGQVSHDGKFTVGTQTLAPGIYSLMVNTK